MGLFNRMAQSLGGGWGQPDRQLLATGLIGRGVITALAQTSQTIGSEQGVNFDVVCDIAMEVTLAGRPAYQVSFRQPVPVGDVNLVVPGQTAMVVRADPADQNRVAIDFELTITHDVAPRGAGGPRVVRSKSVTIGSAMTVGARPAQPQTGSAAEVLANGKPARVALLQCEPYPDMKSAEGLDIFMFAFLVNVAGWAQYGAKVGNPVPLEAQRLLAPWRDLPAKVMPGQPNRVVIDWAAALAENPG